MYLRPEPYRILTLNPSESIVRSESTIDSEGFKGGTRSAPIMPRDAVSRTANVERTGRHKWVKKNHIMLTLTEKP